MRLPGAGGTCCAGSTHRSAAAAGEETQQRHLTAAALPEETLVLHVMNMGYCCLTHPLPLLSGCQSAATCFGTCLHTTCCITGACPFVGSSRAGPPPAALGAGTSCTAHQPPAPHGEAAAPAAAHALCKACCCPVHQLTAVPASSTLSSQVGRLQACGGWHCIWAPASILHSPWGVNTNVSAA